MGLRYQAILRYLGKEFVGVDRETNEKKRLEIAKTCDGIIIASPTETHEIVIQDLLEAKKPILCEKPVSKDIDALGRIIERVEKERVPFRMMYQYSILTNPSRIGKTFYDYFRHGSDGLMWDCLQIIGLARGECVLKENSPLWSCMINGKRLSLADMDAAYIAYIQKWLQYPAQDLGVIRAVHERVHQAIKERESQ